MVTRRKRTVISAPLPPKAKAADTGRRVSVDVTGYRSRPTLPGPFGDEEPPFESMDEPAVVARWEADTAAGMEPVLEWRTRGAGWSPYRRPVYVDELHAAGLAVERTLRLPTKVPGEFRDDTRMEVSAEGQRRIYAAMGVPGGE